MNEIQNEKPMKLSEDRNKQVRCIQHKIMNGRQLLLSDNTCFHLHQNMSNARKNSPFQN